MVSTPLTPFRVVDEGGNPLLEVGRSDGTTFFRLYDGEGNVAIMLLACGGGGGVFLLEGPQQVAAFYAGGDGGTLELRDADGEIRFAAP
jgi:hypothetical protein